MGVFAVEGPADVRVDIQVGRVDIVATARQDLSVTVTPSRPRRSGDRSAAETVSVQRVGSAIVVKGPFRSNLFGPGDSVDVMVEVPEASAVDVAVKYGSAHVSGPLGPVRIAIAYGETTVESATRLEVSGGHGDIRINRVEGDAELAFKSGTARLERIEGDLRIKGSDGSVLADFIGGAADIATSSGGVELGTVGGGVAVRSAYGPVRIRDLVRGHSRIEGSYGTVNVGVRRGIALWLDASSEHARVRTDLASDPGPAEGEETLELHVRTGYGDITIHRSTPDSSETRRRKEKK